MSRYNICVSSTRETKEAAEKVFKRLGLSLSAGINVYLKAVALKKKIPFELDLEIPNEATVEAMEEAKRESGQPGEKFATIEEREKADRKLAKKTTTKNKLH